MDDQTFEGRLDYLRDFMGELKDLSVDPIGFNLCFNFMRTPVDVGNRLFYSGLMSMSYNRGCDRFELKGNQSSFQLIFMDVNLGGVRLVDKFNARDSFIDNRLKPYVLLPFRGDESMEIWFGYHEKD